jgi:hypothetical protein
MVVTKEMQELIDMFTRMRMLDAALGANHKWTPAFCDLACVMYQREVDMLEGHIAPLVAFRIATRLGFSRAELKRQCKIHDVTGGPQ